MFKFNRLNELQSRPHRERQVIAFGLALTITIIVAVIWLITLFEPVKEVLTPTLPDLTTPSTGLSDFITAQWSRVESGWQVVQSYLK